MHRWTRLDDVPADLGATVATLGNFDGVHRGHRQVLASVVERARAGGHAAVVVTFAPHPRTVHLPDAEHEDIVSPRQRIALLEQTGVDAVLQQHPAIRVVQEEARSTVEAPEPALGRLDPAVAGAAPRPQVLPQLVRQLTRRAGRSRRRRG